MMGDGAVVEPTDSEIKAPADGVVQFVFPTKHAIGFLTDDGIEMLLHIGIDTVKLDGQGFEVFVKEGDKLKKGDIIMKIDIDYVRAHAPSLVSPVLCTDLKDNQKIRMIKNGVVKAGEALFAIDVSDGR